MPARTSLTHPLSIATFSLGRGLLGVTLCPGLCAPNAHDPDSPWARDLDDDLDILAFWGAGAVMTLLLPEEMEGLGVGTDPSSGGLSRLGAGVLARGMDWGHVAIAPTDVPDADTAGSLASVFDAALPTIRAGGCLVVHCDTGQARSGSVAAFALTRSGLLPEQAIARVRSVCGRGAIETRDQQLFVARGWV